MELLTSTGKGALHTEKPSAHVLFFYCACAILLLRMCYSSTAHVLFFYCACAYSSTGCSSAVQVFGWAFGDAVWLCCPFESTLVSFCS